MPEFLVDRIHPPTTQRRQRARREGHVAKSHDLATAVTLLGGSLALLLVGGQVAGSLVQLAEQQLGGQAWLSAEPELALASWHLVVGGLGRALIPAFALMVLMAAAGHIGQTGLLLVPNRLVPDLGRIDPLRGVQRLCSSRNLVRSAFGVLKIAAVIAVGAGSLWSDRERLLGADSLDASSLAASLAEIAVWTSLKMSAALIVLGAADYGYQRWRYEQDLRMTDAELREELRNQQGNPQVADRRRRLLRERALQGLEPTQAVTPRQPT